MAVSKSDVCATGTRGGFGAARAPSKLAREPETVAGFVAIQACSRAIREALGA